MKKPKWHAKALYLIFALALVVGLMPLTVLAGHATIVISGPGYAKEGEAVNFTAFTNPEADSVDWFIDGTPVTSDPTPPFELLNVIFPSGSEGPHVVSATGHWGNVVQNATLDILIGVGLIPQLEYNIVGTEATFDVPDAYKGHVKCWSFQASTELGTGWSIKSGGQPVCPNEDPPGDDYVTVRASNQGELVIFADTYAFGSYEATTLMAIKKWGKIYDTWLFGWDSYIEEPIYGSGETLVWWDENSKSWIGGAYLYDLVIGNFITNRVEEFTAPADGADVEWWVLDARAPVHELPSGVPASVLVPAINAMQAAYPSHHVGFYNCDTKYYETVSGDANIDGQMTGLTEVELVACGEEAVKIVVVAKYPYGLHYSEPWAVFPEIISWNFWTQEVEKVPQVRWAGEKIVLEKQFGTSYTGFPVLFNLENQSCGSLFPVSGQGSSPSGAQQVLTEIDSYGVARCILESETQCECDVTCSLYELSESPPGDLINQAGFVVFFLKFEDITLGNVEGEREGHNEGQFTPPNPWADTEEDALGLVDPVDPVTGELNVSQDALLRARVRGWFMGDNLSNRPARVIDSNHNGVEDIHDEVLPAGRWVLPDDWPYLAGHDPILGDIEWMERRPHWDIMTQPNDNIMSEPDGYQYWDFGLEEWVWTEPIDKAEELGDYVEWDLTGPLDVPGDLVAQAPVIGPYNTLDTYTPTIDHDYKLDRKTIVRNGKLNWWDCPMSPAKIIFEITDGPGFFKDADKGDIYYQWVDTDWAPGNESKVYTNPFYETMIPSSPFIPPFILTGGYDWNSWDTTYGPYPFWDIINQPPGITPSDDQHPTKVEVYSDNHGEAMVWLNGFWNLDLSDWATQWGFDVPAGTEVGNTTVKAMADYPYLRKHPYVGSNDVEKTWTWGKEIKLFIESIPTEGGDNDDGWKIAWLFVCDPDGFPATGERVEWVQASATDASIIECMGTQFSDWDFMDTPPHKSAWSTTDVVTSAEIAKFEEFFGAGSYPEGPYGYAVTWAKLYNSTRATADLSVWVFEPDPVYPYKMDKIFRSKTVDYRTSSNYDPKLVGPLAAAYYPEGLAARALPEVLTNVSDVVVAVWYENKDKGVWEKYIPDAPQIYDNILLALEPGELYYFRLKDSGTYFWDPSLGLP
jgi:hypothetical protein